MARLTSTLNLRDKVIEARRLVQEVKKNQLEIKFTQLGNLQDLYLEVYADASFSLGDSKYKSTKIHYFLKRLPR